MIAKASNGSSSIAAANPDPAIPAYTYKPITSPFATEPATCSPYAVSNLQVYL
jgi:hypothetical protein